MTSSHRLPTFSHPDLDEPDLSDPGLSDPGLSDPGLSDPGLGDPTDSDVELFDEPDVDGDQLERAERQSLRRVAGMSTELEDISEVEYRQLRLERVVLVSVWTAGSQVDAENSLAELK